MTHTENKTTLDCNMPQIAQMVATSRNQQELAECDAGNPSYAPVNTLRSQMVNNAVTHLANISGAYAADVASGKIYYHLNGGGCSFKEDPSKWVWRNIYQPKEIAARNQRTATAGATLANIVVNGAVHYAHHALVYQKDNHAATMRRAQVYQLFDAYRKDSLACANQKKADREFDKIITAMGYNDAEKAAFTNSSSDLIVALQRLPTLTNREQEALAFHLTAIHYAKYGTLDPMSFCDVPLEKCYVFLNFSGAFGKEFFEETSNNYISEIWEAQHTYIAIGQELLRKAQFQFPELDCIDIATRTSEMGLCDPYGYTRKFVQAGAKGVVAAGFAAYGLCTSNPACLQQAAQLALSVLPNQQGQEMLSAVLKDTGISANDCSKLLA